MGGSSSATGVGGVDRIMPHPTAPLRRATLAANPIRIPILRFWFNGQVYPWGLGESRLLRLSAWSIREYRMGVYRSLLCCAVAAAAVATGCAAHRAPSDELGAQDASQPAAGAAEYSVPLDLREFEVAEAEGGYRGVFLRLSRLPTSVVTSTQSDPPRIIVDIQGPTGTESAEEMFPASDAMVTHVGVSRHLGWLRVVLDLHGGQLPEYAVYPMADWVVVRIKPLHIEKRPWAHRAS
jgi:hypothetical protein